MEYPRIIGVSSVDSGWKAEWSGNPDYEEPALKRITELYELCEESKPDAEGWIAAIIMYLDEVALQSANGTKAQYADDEAEKNANT